MGRAIYPNKKQVIGSKRQPRLARQLLCIHRASTQRSSTHGVPHTASARLTAQPIKAVAKHFLNSLINLYITYEDKALILLSIRAGITITSLLLLHLQCSYRYATERASPSSASRPSTLALKQAQGCLPGIISSFSGLSPCHRT